MKTILLSTALASLALAQPAWAQESDESEVPEQEVTLGIYEASSEEGDGEASDEAALAMVGALLGTMFQADPLTPEAEARLPQASAVAASLVPEGVYGEMMGQMVDSFLSPIMKLAEADGGGMSASDLTDYTGLWEQNLEELSAEERIELTQIFDPVYETRTRAQMDMIVGAANSVFALLEPGVRDGVAKAYASRFDATELAALNAFFASPVGAKYASQSLVINTDPQVISGMMQSIPSLLEQLPTLIETFESAEAGLPEPRGFDDLTPFEKRRAAELLGVEQDYLEESMAAAAAHEEWMEEDMEEAMEDAWDDTEADLEAMEEAAEDSVDAATDEMEEAAEEVGG